MILEIWDCHICFNQLLKYWLPYKLYCLIITNVVKHNGQVIHVAVNCK